MRSLVLVRESLARGPLGPPIRALRLQRVFDSLVYEPLVTARGWMPVKVAGRDLRFAVSNRREAARVADATGEEAHLESLAREAREGDVFYDIGANIGMFACAVAAVSPGVEAHAFEPEPGTLARLRKNIELNKLDGRVRAHAVALSDTDGEMDMTLGGDVGSGTHSLFDGHSRNGGDRKAKRVKVAVRAAEGFMRSEAIPPPTLIKCDVEGAEAQALRGLGALLDPSRLRRLDVEFHRSTLERQGESVEALERMVEQKGFRIESRWERGDTSNVVFRPA